MPGTAQPPYQPSRKRRFWLKYAVKSPRCITSPLNTQNQMRCEIATVSYSRKKLVEIKKKNEQPSELQSESWQSPDRKKRETFPLHYFNRKVEQFALPHCSTFAQKGPFPMVDSKQLAAIRRATQHT